MGEDLCLNCVSFIKWTIRRFIFVLLRFFLPLFVTWFSWLIDTNSFQYREKGYLWVHFVLDLYSRQNSVSDATKSFLFKTKNHFCVVAGLLGKLNPFCRRYLCLNKWQSWQRKSGCGFSIVNNSGKRHRCKLIMLRIRQLSGNMGLTFLEPRSLVHLKN